MRFRQVFSNRHVILPVIHMETEEQAIHNALLARDSGCDGVFLINHSVSNQVLLAAHSAVKSLAPELWVGVNCLGLEEPRSLFNNGDLDGVWVDNAGIDERAGVDGVQTFAERQRAAKEASHWEGLYFGGVAFKYQRSVADLPQAARIAAGYMDVVTTSGPGTGAAPDVSKMEAMKSAIPDFPIAIASGITVENVAHFLPYADCFLVATGISKSFTELDPNRVEALVACVRSVAA